MILVELRPRGGKKQTIAVHTGVTVLRGLDAAARRTWATDLARALRGETSSSLDVEVEIDGTKRPLSPQLVGELGLGDAASAVTVFAVDLPGAKPFEADGVAAEAPAKAKAKEPETAPAPASDDLVALEADLATAEATVDRLAKELAEAERSATSAADERTNAGRLVPKDANAAVSAAEGRLEAARVAAATARQQLTAAEEVARSESDAVSAKSEEAKAKLQELQSERGRLEVARSELLGRMVENGDPGDPKPVQEALAGLRRLKSVKPKTSPRALELADQWVEARKELRKLPQPPQPPEWLVQPALAALQEAREGVAAAESGSTGVTVDPSLVDALDRAHRDVLEAEQRAMKKGSRLNRRRLDAAHQTEHAALLALGVNSYGEYLQRIAPSLEDTGSGEDRLAAARAALADAEAVWEELHGGEASPEWTAAKERQASIRTEALAMLERDVDDAELEEALRAHLETVVDTEWAEQALMKALRGAGAAPAPGVDVEAAAEQWLADAPSLHESRQRLQAELSELDGQLAAVEEQLAEHQADAFFGDGDDRGKKASSSSGGPLEALRKAAAEAEAAEAEADRALSAGRATRADAETQQAKLTDLEAAADARRNEVDRLRTALREAEAARDEVRARSAATAKTTPDPEPEPAPEPGPAPAPAKVAANGAVDLSAVVGMEAEAYLLARVASLRGAPGGPLPLVLDGEAVAGLPEAAGRRVYRLLGRLAGSMQVVVLGDDDAISTWAEGLGDRAAVRQVAR